MENTKPKASFLSQIFSLPANFWCACFMEIFERLAFFGSRAVAPLFLVASAGENGLGLNYKEKGIIYTVWALLQCLIPMVSGGYTDRYGYRKSLAVAFILNIIGYVGMAQSKDIADWLAMQGWEQPAFWVFMVAACFVATGTAIFKPPAHGTIAATTTEETSSMGWGVFYWVVNIGGALAPMGAATLRAEIDWHIVFYAAAIVTAMNFLPAFLLYKEPKKPKPKEGEEQPKGPIGVFMHSILTIFKDLRLVVFLGIFSCFWLMFMQLWDLLPNFIDEWIDSSDVASVFGWFSDSWVLGSGQVKPEMIINIDAIAIILLVIPLSWLIGKINKVAAMIIGMLISLVAFVASGSAMVGWFCCLAVFVFSIGEMACSPTFSAYVGLIAPKDKKALYMGYSNIPFAIGWALGNLIGGFIYEDHGAKANLALKELASRPELVARAASSADWSDSLHMLPPLMDIPATDAFEVVVGELATTPEAAADTLRTIFRNDRGQIDNLCLQYLALHADNKAKMIPGLASAVATLGTSIASDGSYFAQEVTGLVKPNDEQQDASSQPTEIREVCSARPLVGTSSRIDVLVEQTCRLARGEATLDDIEMARYLDLVPGCLDVKRGDVMEKVRELVNKDVDRPVWQDDSQITAMLWERFGSDPAVLDNLALEYLAQATGRMQAAIEQIGFVSAADELEARAKEIEERIGISSAKAFSALSAAVGRSAADVDRILDEAEIVADRQEDRPFMYLINNSRYRFEAVTQMAWNHDTGLLRELVRDDAKAREIVIEKIDDIGILERIARAIKGLFTEDEYEGEMTAEGINYHKLAQNKDLIQKALAVKDWSGSSRTAARVLRLNTYEARALIAADEKGATQLLWDKYDPFIVWYYLGGIGLLGTIGMIFFYFATKKPKEENGTA